MFCICFIAFLQRTCPGRAISASPFLRLATASVLPLAIGLLSPLPALVDTLLAVLAFAGGAWLLGAVPEEIRHVVLRLSRR